MAYTPATKYPSNAVLTVFQWSRPDAENPRLAAPVSSSATTLTFTNAPKDKDGSVLTSGFLMNAKDNNGYTEIIYVPAGTLSGDGLTATGVVRGIRPEGLDFTTGDSAFAVDLPQDAPVGCAVAQTYHRMMIGALQGTIASGAANWKIGNAVDENITVYAFNGDANNPFWRYDSATNQWVFSNDGVSSTPFGTGSGVTEGNGIDVTAGVISAVGNSNRGITVSSSGIGADGLEREFTLNENISAGTGVKIVSNSGAKLALATTSVSQVIGSSIAFEAGSATEGAICFDPNTRQFIAAWDEAGTSCKYVVGSISDTISNSISIGTVGTVAAINVAANSVGNSTAAVYDTSTSRVVLVYGDTTNSQGRAIIGTVTGTVVSWGTPVAFDTAAIVCLNACFDSTNSKVVIAYRDAGDTNKGKAIVGTVSGTTISFGTEVEFEAGATSGIACSFDSTNGKVVIFFTDDGDTNKGKAIVGTVSGTSISFGTAVNFDAANLGANSYKASAFDIINGKVVCAYNAGSTAIKSLVGTVSGTSISFGSTTTIETVTMSAATIGASYDPFSGKVLVSWNDTTNSDGDVAEGTVSGTSISYVITSQGLDGGSTPSIASCYDNFNKRVIVTYRDANIDQAARAVTLSGNVPDLTNFIGVLEETGTTGQSKPTALIGGIASGFTGKTPGAAVYLAAGGALITDLAIGGTQVGNFISDTELFVKKPNNT